MEISKASVGILVATCVAAGAGGAYLVTRDTAPAAAASYAELPELAPPAGAVQHSESVLTGAAEATEEAVAPAPVAVAPPPPPPARTSTPDRIGPRRPQPQPAREASNSADEATAPAPAAPAPVVPAPLPLPIEPPAITDNEPSRTVAPAGPVYEELVVAADSVIGLEIETSVTSERAQVEDPVTARVTRDVRVGDRVAIPAGSRVNGEVTVVERGGRLKDRARLGVRFTSIVLADGTRLPISTDTVFREGESPTGGSAAKIGGGAIGGAIIGGILGGAKGAAIGSAVGAGGGTAAVLAGGRNAATLSAGTAVTVRVQDPVVVTVER